MWIKHKKIIQIDLNEEYLPQTTVFIYGAMRRQILINIRQMAHY